MRTKITIYCDGAASMKCANGEYIRENVGCAQGCGNCKNCELIVDCRSCNDYYNPEPIRSE